VTNWKTNFKRKYNKGEAVNIPINSYEQQIKNAKHAANIFMSILRSRPEEDKHKEFFYIMGLNSQNNILFVDLITMGSIDCASPVIRECFRWAIVKNAVGIIACHNHPSGTLAPSQQDRHFTRKLKEAGSILNCTVLDHIIVGDKGDCFYSFSEALEPSITN